MKTGLIILILMMYNLGYFQFYIQKQTSHRFAQLNLGVDFQSSFGSSTHYLDAEGLAATRRFRIEFS